MQLPTCGQQMHVDTTLADRNLCLNVMLATVAVKNKRIDDAAFKYSNVRKSPENMELNGAVCSLYTGVVRV